MTDHTRRRPARAEVRGDEPTGELQVRPRPEPGSQAALVVLSGGDVGRFLRLPARFLIGRGSGVDLQVPGPGVSRQHAIIEQMEDGSFQLRDLDSHNGTLVNGHQVLRQTLRFGDQIDVGGETRLRFVYKDEVDLHLQEAQRLEAVGQLAGGIAHEFNNLLAVVLGNLTVIRDAPGLPPELRAHLEDCISATQRGADLTRDLLSFARQSDVARAPVDVGELVRGLTSVLRGTFDRGITITCDATPGLTVMGDASRLQQVLLNIAVNARDAMPCGGELAIRVDAVEPAGVSGLFAADVSAARFVRIRLEDSGHGMDAATQARIFEPFFTTKDIGHGTGLGLALAHGIVGSHHGAITVDSAPGAGTTFTVLLPEASTQEATLARTSRRRATLDAVPDLPAPLPEAGAATGRDQTVLIVDDEPAIRRLSEHVLAAAGFRVLQAEDGTAALEQLRRLPGGIGHVLLDVNMPRLDGEQVCREIQVLDAAIHLILCSGNPDDPRVLRLRQAPGVTWLAKPFAPAALLQAVGAVGSVRP